MHNVIANQPASTRRRRGEQGEAISMAAERLPRSLQSLAMTQLLGAGSAISRPCHCEERRRRSNLVRLPRPAYGGARNDPAGQIDIKY